MFAYSNCVPTYVDFPESLVIFVDIVFKSRSCIPGNETKKKEQTNQNLNCNFIFDCAYVIYKKKNIQINSHEFGESLIISTQKYTLYRNRNAHVPIRPINSRCTTVRLYLHTMHTHTIVYTEKQILCVRLNRVRKAK